MTATLMNWLQGDLSPETRVWTAAAPALVLAALVVVAMVAFSLNNRWRGPYHDADVESRGSTWLIGMWFRRCFVWALQPILSLLLRTRLPPAAITTLSLLLAAGAAAAIAAGRMALGGWLFVSAGICDALDGRLARESNAAGPGGAVLDSVIDRYVDGLLFLGLAWFYRDSWVLIPVLVALLGSLLVPYVRAKGEAMGVRFSNVGLAQRPERVAILGLSVALSPIVEAVLVPHDPRPIHRLAILGILVVGAASHLTSLQRLVHTRRALDGGESLVHLAGRGGLIRHGVSAALATAADFALVLLLVGWGSVAPPAATLLGCLFGAAVNFLTNRIWAFSGRSVPIVQAARYTLVSMSSATLNAGLVAILLLLPEMPYALAWIVVRSLVSTVWNYPLQRDYVFAAPRRVADCQ
jgi:phosphatidylglycerophosphate synthase